ncbi:MAG: YhcH/YjgK/YiaL family protein [Planctomycetaceae bacterium]|nr:YhcH/YjgK/YiaL family protein [Planctomycetaceae bacterium]|tara:strand:+ start:980 stop:1429 length:450 start_codon:yes stop_codon:yes gene_type:complete
MIFDRLSNAAQYYGVASLIQKGFEFLQRPELASLEDGVHEIQGRDVYAIIARGNGVGREQAMLEAHRNYLDIQYVIEGTDKIGWLERDFVERVKDPYDAEKDLEFFYDRPASWIQVPAGSFAIFLPQDIHAPLATSQYVHKAVVKVKLI